jgi:YD repeat-containing protein
MYTYSYDADQRPTSLALPNGVATTYAYDNVGRLNSMITRHGVATLASYSYTLGATGLCTRIDEADGVTRSYVYDPAYRLTSETITGSGATDYSAAFTYDTVGNRLTQVTTGATPGEVAYTYDSRDRLLTEGRASYVWDANGNLLSKSGGDTYTWDFEDRLTKVTKPDGTLVEHVYDADGTRVRTTVTAVGGSPVVTNYLVDVTSGLSQVVAESDGTGVVGNYYVRAGNDLLGVRRGPVLACYVKDGLGSVTALTDGAGAVTDRRSYRAFGETLSASGTDPQPYAFAGEAFEAVSGLSWTLNNFPGGFEFSMAGANPFVPGPTVDTYVRGNVEATSSALDISGWLEGDEFPSAELFIVDRESKPFMRSIFSTPHNATFGPFIYLFGENFNELGHFNYHIPLRSDGTFQSGTLE